MLRLDQEISCLSSEILIIRSRDCDLKLSNRAVTLPAFPEGEAILWPSQEDTMKTWTKPAVREQEVGLEVTSYLPAEIDII